MVNVHNSMFYYMYILGVLLIISNFTILHFQYRKINISVFLFSFGFLGNNRLNINRNYTSLSKSYDPAKNELCMDMKFGYNQLGRIKVCLSIP